MKLFMKQIRVILETDLHNDCGLIAAAAFKYLSSHGVKSKVLNIRYGKSDGHTVVVFESAGRICTYDHDGSLIYEHGTSWKTPPLLLARAWVKANGVKKKVLDAKWL
jgi:hypothetical protein